MPGYEQCEPAQLVSLEMNHGSQARKSPLLGQKVCSGRRQEGCAVWQQRTGPCRWMNQENSSCKRAPKMISMESSLAWMLLQFEHLSLWCMVEASSVWSTRVCPRWGCSRMVSSEEDLGVEELAWEKPGHSQGRTDGQNCNDPLNKKVPAPETRIEPWSSPSSFSIAGPPWT